MPNPFFGLRRSFSGGGSSRPSFTFGDSGPERSDLTTQAIAEMLRQAKGRYLMDEQEHEAGMRMSNPDPMPRGSNLSRMMSRNTGVSGGGVPGQMDVVYDQRPEMFDKQMKFQKDMAAQNQKNLETQRGIDALAANDAYIDNRRKNEMAGREQQLRENVANYGMQNPELKIEAIPGGNVVAINPRTGKVMDTGQGSGQMSDAEKMRVQNENALGQIDRRNAGDLAAANARANATMQPNAGEMEQRTVDKARELILTNPEFANLLEFSDDGKSFRIKDRPKGTMWSAAPDDSDARRRLGAALYGDKNVTKVGGVNSAALGGSPGSAGVSGDISKRGSPTPSHVTGLPTAPPKGAKPGGKWVQLRSGRTVYMEP